MATSTVSSSGCRAPADADDGGSASAGAGNDDAAAAGVDGVVIHVPPLNVPLRCARQKLSQQLLAGSAQSYSDSKRLLGHNMKSHGSTAHIALKSKAPCESEALELGLKAEGFGLQLGLGSCSGSCQDLGRKAQSLKPIADLIGSVVPEAFKPPNPKPDEQTNEDPLLDGQTCL